jgi:hypothetical protein
VTQREAYQVANALRRGLEQAPGKKQREGVILAGTAICDLLLLHVEGLDEAMWMGAWCYPTEQERRKARRWSR